MKRILIFCLLFVNLIISVAQSTKEMQATRALSPPRIDGIIDDSCWLNAQPASSFTQYIPIYNVNPTQQSEIRIVYDDNAIYVAALLFDTSPDSILKELGGRDDELNGDFFELNFDTYNMQSDAYTFGVYASGVQFDSREEDPTFDGVWKSAVKITDKGWMIELMIPFSAIRFPAVTEQVWGLEIIRSIRRHREHDYWALPVKGASNELVYWGKLKGITGITAPLRLSITPYISVYGDHFPYNISDKSNYSYSFSGGLDLKYGLNESYTLDMTLLPDFSQVQSDYDVKNISAFETVYDENRPFFNEAVDLFQKGDLFYSRRIGKEPDGYNDIYNSLSDGSHVIKNPSQAKLINATKLSGRSRKGTAIGFLNALTRNTYAEIEDSTGNTYTLLTEPLTNYNILVFDQVLKNNSDVYITNSSVIRDKKYKDANVTAAGITLHNRSITWQLGASGALSQIMENAGTKSFNNQTGYQYSLNFGKVKGNFHFMLTRSTINDTYNDNDLGLTLMNNQTTNNLALSYSIYEPFWKCRDFNVSMNIKHIENFRTKYLEDVEISISNYETLLNYLSVWDGIGVRPLQVNDFYEARVPGRVYLAPAYYYGTLGFSSDYRKAFALDFEGTYIGGINDELKIIEARLVPIIRASDKFMFKYHINGSFTMNDKGFAAIDSLNTINFGRRNITTLENLLEARYIFMNDLWIGLNARHYWSMAQYDKFYELMPDGHLDNNTSYTGSHDFNFNAFNLDLQFSWQFAPGSNLSFVYKNIINNDENKARPAYFRNFRHTFESDQLNSISLKVLYYLDYSYLVKRKIK